MREIALPTVSESGKPLKVKSERNMALTDTLAIAERLRKCCNGHQEFVKNYNNVADKIAEFCGQASETKELEKIIIGHNQKSPMYYLVLLIDKNPPTPTDSIAGSRRRMSSYGRQLKHPPSLVTGS